MRHWVFDFDGTLVDSEGYFSESFAYALGPYNMSVDRSFIEAVRHKHPDDIFEDLLPPDKAQRALERLAEYGRSISDRIQVFQGIVDVLETLDKQGASLSIWTGRDRKSTELILGKNALDGVFDKIITGTCVEVNKPGHDGLLEIKKHRSAQEDEMVMIGDHHHDIEPANALGIHSVHARWKNNPHQLPEKIKPKDHFGSVTDFHLWVKEKLKE